MAESVDPHAGARDGLNCEDRQAHRAEPRSAKMGGGPGGEGRPGCGKAWSRLTGCVPPHAAAGSPGGVEAAAAGRHPAGSGSQAEYAQLGVPGAAAAWAGSPCSGLSCRRLRAPAQK